MQGFLRSVTIALASLFVWTGGAAAAAIESFALPGALAANDDGSSAAVGIGFPINFFGVTHTQLFVNNNGNVTFGAALGAFTPFGLTGTQTAIIAPFFADVDTRGAGSDIVRFGTPSGRPDLFVVDWVRVGYFNEKDDKLNSFQLILQDLSAVPEFAPGDFRIIFNYDRIRWETGDASGGSACRADAPPASDGLGGCSARVGFSNGSGQPGTFFELRGSGENGALLDGRANSLVGNRVPPADTSLPRGRYQFVVQNGAVAQADLAVAAEAFEDGDDFVFDVVVRNFGPSDAETVGMTFQLTGNNEEVIITSVSPERFCQQSGPRKANCQFVTIPRGGSQRIRVTTNEVVGAFAFATSDVFETDLSNNTAAPTGARCQAQILSRSAPESVRYEPTATLNARQILRLALINTASEQSVEIRRIRLRGRLSDPAFGPPVQITSITPPLPRTIPPRGNQLFRVDTLLPAGAPARDAGRPYFLFRARCAG
jgi:hypothetical protein